MSVISELVSRPGVIAAGEYSFRGDRYTYEGDMTEEMARMAAVMCRSTSLGVHMETHMLETLHPGTGLTPGKGWAVRGPQFSVCVMSNYFCFMQNGQSAFNDTVHYMTTKFRDSDDTLI